MGYKSNYSPFALQDRPTCLLLPIPLPFPHLLENSHSPSIFYPVFLVLLCQIFPVEIRQIDVEPLAVVAVSAVVEPLGTAVAIVLVWLSLEIAALSLEVVAETAVVGTPGVVAVIAVVWLLLELAVLPEILVGPLEMDIVNALGASTLGHPRYFASPNVCFYPRCSSSVVLVAGVFVGSSIDALANDDSCSRSSSLVVSLDKKMEHFDSSPNLNCSSASDTIAHSMDATTNRYRKKFPHLRPGRNRHSSQVSPPSPEVRQIG